MTDEINRGERSDRLVVRWDLQEMRPGARPHAGIDVLSRDGDEDLPHPSQLQAPMGDLVLIAIPREYHDLRTADPHLGHEWREASGAALQACWDAGYRVTGFTKDGAYVLEQSELRA
jgi:predicted GNAT superfamily acetyltransferase